MHLRLALSSGVWTLPVVPAMVLEHVALWSLANGRVVRCAGAGCVESACKGSIGTGIVARVGREGALGVDLGSTDCFDHFVSFHFDFPVSQFSHQAQELAVPKFVCVIVLDFLE
jgi:hypothetical protein